MRQAAQALLRDPEAAADAVQETLARLWHRRWRLSLMKNPQGFAMTALKNQALSMLRHQKHFAPAAVLAEMPDDDGTEAAEQRFRRLEEALGKLPEAQQRFIRMRYVEQRSTREMAGGLKMSEEAVNTAMSRAYQKLRNELTDTI